MPISTTGSINELLGRCGEITLSDIKTQAEIINAYNYWRDQEDEKIYTF